MPYTNNNNISLSLAVWLLNDTYDYNSDPNVISVTTLLKPLRAIVLGRTIPSTNTIDIADLIASRMGTAIHEAIEQAWKKPQGALKSLGYPDKIIDKLVINPTLEKDILPIYMEKRSKKQVGPFTLSGKFDFIIDGQLEDFKSTSTWAWVFQSNVSDYKLQGSMYRYLNQDIVDDDHIKINYIFTDWSATKAKQDKEYPQSKIMSKQYPLMSVPETENWIRARFKAIEAMQKDPQVSLPQCTKEELWQSDSVWKYYKNPKNKARSTKNFTNPAPAYVRLADDGSVGEVIEVPGEAKRCHYCNARPVCTQAQNLELTGVLKI